MTLRALFDNPEPDNQALTPEQLEQLIDLQAELLKSTVTTSDYNDLLTQLCLQAEKLCTGSLASIMLYAKKEDQLFVHTAPNIPLPVIDDLNGLKSGDGTCGNAVFHNEEMYVIDTMSDIRWENVRSFAKTYSLGSCWSNPIKNHEGEAIGSFALTSFNTGAPNNFQRRLLNTCTAIAGIIFQRIHDESEQFANEQKLDQSETSLAATLDSIGEGVISTDANNVIVNFNRVAEEFTGYTAAEAIGKDLDEILDIINSENINVVCNPMQCLHKTAPCYKHDKNLQLMSADGTLREVSVNESPIEDANGNITGAVLAVRDITEEQKKNRQILAQQQQYLSIIENSADALFLINDHGDFIDVNPMACSNLGYTRHELLGMNVFEISSHIRDKHSNFKQFSKTLETGKTRTIESIHVRKDGSKFPVEVHVRRYISNNTPQIIAQARDITERKQAEEELLKTQKLESIGLLAGGIAHDFNNLLGIIKGYVELASRNSHSPEKTMDYLSKAGDATSRATDLTQQLLTFSKGGEPVRRAANITDVIHQSTDFSLHGTNMTVDYKYPEDLWTASIDCGQISQVIQNLAINARQAMSDSGHLSIQCENVLVNHSQLIPDLDAGKYIKITFSDSGPGISSNILDSVFDPYFTTKQEGNGLGLALSYSIIKKHNGHMTVNSIQGKGACFTMFLPVTEEDTPVMTDAISNKTQHTNARILLMDDDEMIREVGEEMIQDLGYDVIQAKDGEEAITLYKESLDNGNKIDLVIMDLTIPNGLGGQDAIMEIKQLDPEAKGLVSSGYCNDPVMANHEEYGFAGAVSKPYSQAELGEVIDHILQQ